MQLSDEELSAESIRLSAILPELENRIDKLNLALDNKVFGLISEGALTSELALAFWYERFARTNVVRSMKTRVITHNQGKSGAFTHG
jgi:hypothetical protein